MTAESFLGGKVILHPGDCLDVLKTLEENSVDSVVTDPPYHLVQNSRHGSSQPGDMNTPYGRSGPSKVRGGFMGKEWDGGDIAFRPELWKQVLRVLKPGGHLVSFGGTRTYHRMACAIEDAGFEIRDQIQWLYGSGFPKSHDVSKGIDKRRDEDDMPVRVVCRFLRAAMARKSRKSHDMVRHFDGCHPRLIDHWAARDTDSQPALPTWPQWIKLKEVLSLPDDMDGEVWRLNGRKGEPSDDYKSAEIIGEHDGVAPGLVGLRFDGDNTIRAPSNDAAEWQGWGTALKPAAEPICLARKPLSESTVAANVLRWGVGALNIDGCRVEAPEGLTNGGAPSGANNPCFMSKDDDPRTERGNGHALGRFPANVIHDGSDEVVGVFPETVDSPKGTITQGGVRINGGNYGNTEGNGQPRGTQFQGHGDSGSAARFFYSAKADADDRLGSKHPTVKKVDLMQWLCRLVTPKGGTVLDCFSGTGTTGEAAWREGFNAVLIERESEYCNDIRRRMALCLAGPAERKRESNKARHGDKPFEAGTLFA